MISHYIDYYCVLYVLYVSCMWVPISAWLNVLVYSAFLTLFIVSAKPIYCNYHVLYIIAVFVQHLRQFIIDLHQTYTHSSVPQNTYPCTF